MQRTAAAAAATGARLARRAVAAAALWRDLHVVVEGVDALELDGKVVGGNGHLSAGLAGAGPAHLRARRPVKPCVSNVGAMRTDRCLQTGPQSGW